MKENAFYHEQNIVEFIGNPLIESLPPMEDPLKYPKRLMVLPDYSEDEREESPGRRNPADAPLSAGALRDLFHAPVLHFPSGLGGAPLAAALDALHELSGGAGGVEETGVFN